ncbi:MAG: hypothetical protein ACJAY8_000431 [Sphingobacteriales bacterium]
MFSVIINHKTSIRKRAKLGRYKTVLLWEIMKTMDLKLHTGLDDLILGVEKEVVEKLWGEPDEIEEMVEEDGTLLVWHYDEKETSLSFDPIFENRLSGIAVSHEDLLFQGEKLMGKSESDVLALMESFGIDDLEGEEMEEGEALFLSMQAGLTLFFDQNELLEIKISPDFNEETEEVTWPK